MNTPLNRHWSVIPALLLLVWTGAPVPAAQPSPTSRPISAVLRQPLPPEEITLSEHTTHFLTTGPTFTYHLNKSTGAITPLRVLASPDFDGHPRAPLACEYARPCR